MKVPSNTRILFKGFERYDWLLPRERLQKKTNCKYDTKQAKYLIINEGIKEMVDNLKLRDIIESENKKNIINVEPELVKRTSSKMEERKVESKMDRPK